MHRIGDPAAECDIARRELGCEIEVLAAHETAVIAVTVLTRRPGMLSATATLTSSEYTSDPDESNNADSETTLVLRR